MANLLRHKVSKKKRRFMQDGFDLDLSYITDRIIAMGFPADKVEGLYRNPIKQVKKFYEQKHADHYKLYNLCAERTYDPKKFHGRVSHYPFEDHNAPPVDLIVRCCKDIEDWLAASTDNIVGINCKAGKGRTGLIICCYLLHSKECKTTDEALTYYGHKRTHDGKGVTIASQQRYIRYYEKILQLGGIPPIRALYLNKLRVHTLPNFPSDPYLTIEMKGHIVFKTAPVKVPSSKSGEAYFDIDCSNTPVFGDVKIQLSCAAGNKTQNLCHYWFNTGFVDETNKVTLYKGEIDVANKDKKCVRFKSEFALEMFFDEIEGEHKGKIPQVVITEEDNPKSPSKKRRRIVSVVLSDNTVDPPKEVLVIDKTKKNTNAKNNNNSDSEQPTEGDTKPSENGHDEKPTEANGEKPKDKKDKDGGRNRGRSFYHYKEYSDEGKHAKDEDVSSTTSEEFQEYFESFEESNSTEIVVQNNTNANARKDSATNLKESGKGTKNSPKPKRASKDDDSTEAKTKSPRTKSKTDIRVSDSPRKTDDAEKKPAEGAEPKDKKDKKDKKEKKADKPAEPVAEKKDEPKTLQVNEGDKTTKRKGSKKELKKEDKKDDKEVKAEHHEDGKKDETTEHPENKDVKKVKGESTPKGSPKPEKKTKEDKKAEKEKKKQDEKDEKEKKKHEEEERKAAELKKKQDEKEEKEKKKLEEKEDKKKHDDKKGKKEHKEDKPAEDKEEEVSSPKTDKKTKEKENGPESKKPAKEKENGTKDKAAKEDEVSSPKTDKKSKEKENGAAEKKKAEEKEEVSSPKADKKKEKKDKANGTAAETKEAAVTTD